MVFNRIDCQGYVNKQKCRRHKVNFDLVNKSVDSVVFLKLNLVNAMRVYCSINVCVQCTAFAVYFSKSPIVLLTTEDSAKISKNCFKLSYMIVIQ